MKFISHKYILLLCFTLITLCSFTLEDQRQQQQRGKNNQMKKDTTQSSKKQRFTERTQRQNRRQTPTGLFIALNSLIGGTVIDTFTGYRNVSRLIQTAFAPPQTTTGNATAPANGTSFTLRQALRLLGRNYLGLRKLFDNEFTKALNVSEKNALDFRKELKNSARLFLEYGGRNANIVA